MMTYNMTLLQEASTLPKMFAYAETVSGNIFSGLLLLAIFFIMLMALKRWDFAQAIMSSSFACFVLALFLSTAGILSFTWVLLFLSATAFSALYVWTRGRG